MRADARRNHELLLDAARDVFVERGPDAPLDEIARRAGVGIATLYRRFPDRRSLMHAVVLRALTLTAEAGERARREIREPLDALAAYVHAVIDLRTSAVIPTLLGHLDLTHGGIAEMRRRSAAAAEELVSAARDSGGLHRDVTFGDVGLMLVRLSRPLPGAIAPEMQQELAHRHAELFLAGLRAGPRDQPLQGPALELRDLQQLRPDESGDGATAGSAAPHHAPS